MAIKKYTSGAWAPTSYRKFGTETDTITSLPAQIIGDGQPITSCQISGNTVQDGTPTPEAPVDVVGCGARAGNLIDKTKFTGIIATIEQIESGIRIVTKSGGYAARIILDVLQNTNYTVSYIWKRISGISTNTVRVFAGTDASTEIAVFEYKTGGTFNTGNNTKINIWFYAYSSSGTAVTVEYTNIMLNTGSTALPYEPYGQYKIPISSAGQTTPIYLGEVESTRQIKKLVMTGEESWSLWSSGHPDVERFYYKWGRDTSDNQLICTHFPNLNGDGNFDHIRLDGSNRDDFVIFISRTIATTVADFKSYLAAQYAAGTPVTAWYILATSETSIVNEPLMKIGDYADTVVATNVPTTGTAEQFDIQTTLKPSEVSLTYRGWHEHTDTKYTE